MDDRRTPMEAEVQELLPEQAPACPDAFYGTAVRPRPLRSYAAFWICLGLAIIAVSTFSIVATLLHSRTAGAEEEDTSEDLVRYLEVSASETYVPAEDSERGELRFRVDSGKGEVMTSSDVYAQVSPAVVCVEVETYYSSTVSTGVVITADGYILSATEGLSATASVTVVFADGTELSARKAGEERATGLCLLKVEAEGLPTVAFAEDESLTVGQRIFCICNPYGRQLPNVFYEGMLSAAGKAELGSWSGTILQTSVQSQDVGYGCPILDARGRVLGLTTPVGQRLVSGEDPCFALSAADLQTVLAAFENAASSSACWLGLEVEDIPEDYLLLFGYPGGIWISEVAQGTAPDRVLFQYDIIIAVDDTEVSTAAEFNRLIAAHQPGDRVRLTIYRNGQCYTTLLPVIPQ